jgi:hypothetical protein
MTTTQADPLNMRYLVEGLALGVAYGLLFRLLAHFSWPGPSVVMSIGFLFLGPMVMGILAVRRASVATPAPVWMWFALPIGTVFLAMLAAILLYLEGTICVVFAFPIALVGAILGGVIGGLASRSHYRINRGTTACIAVIPFLIASAEPGFTAPTHIRTVASEIRIHASPEIVWNNIERVPAISPSELHTTWAQRIGFPRPVEATLSYQGIGGVRHASFERGLTFIETVTAWEPKHRLAFGIKADTAHIPPTTLDEHVTIGGRYFDVLDGEYLLEPLPNGDVLLHLTSHQRLSTDFNGYAGLWSDAVMQNLQSSILEVIQHRCEHA